MSEFKDFVAYETKMKVKDDVIYVELTENAPKVFDQRHLSMDQSSMELRLDIRKNEDDFIDNHDKELLSDLRVDKNELVDDLVNAKQDKEDKNEKNEIKTKVKTIVNKIENKNKKVKRDKIRSSPIVKRSPMVKPKYPTPKTGKILGRSKPKISPKKQKMDEKRIWMAR